MRARAGLPHRLQVEVAGAFKARRPTGRTPALRDKHVAAGPDHRAHLIWYDTRHSDADGPKVEIYYGRPVG